MDATLLDASRREEALYRDLLAIYTRVLDDLAAEAVDPVRVAAGHSAAARTSAALREVSAAIAPYRVGAAAVADEVAALWRSSAELAAACLGANRTVVAHARMHQQTLARRLAGLAVGRRALGAYRPLGGAIPGSVRCA